MLRIVRAKWWEGNLECIQQTNLRTKYEIESEIDAKYTFYDRIDLGPNGNYPYSWPYHF